MGNQIDLTNQIFGRLTAIKIVGKTKQYVNIWECKCDCGNICNVNTRDLRSGHTQSCGCSRFENLTGQKYGRLTVIERDKARHGNGVYWLCQCECGNQSSVRTYSLKNGITKSCGCLVNDINSQPKVINNMINKKFGYLTVIERADTHISSGGQKKVMWLCRCDCGHEKVVASQDLKSGHTQSCGCKPKKIKGNGLINLIGQRFGKLTVVERAEDYSYQSKNKKTTLPRWLCQCDCGNTIIVQGGNLRNGATTNCGCARVYSKGEKYVSDFLKANNIKYLREYHFNDLKNKSGNYLRFDFAILNNDNKVIMLIEYQGEQHYIDCGYYGAYQRKYSDPMKKAYCRLNNIPLFEIKFDDDLNEISLKLLKTIKKYNEI